MLHVIPYTIVNCLEFDVKSINGKAIMCIKILPRYNHIPDSIYELLRGLLPIDGKNEYIEVCGGIEADCEKLMTEDSSPLTLFMHMDAHLKSCLRQRHYDAFLDLLKLVEESNPSFEQMMDFAKFASGKARLGVKASIPLTEAERQDNVFKKLTETREQSGFGDMVKATPIGQSIFNFVRDLMDNLELSIFAPRMMIKFMAKGKKFGTLLKYLSKE